MPSEKGSPSFPYACQKACQGDDPAIHHIRLPSGLYSDVRCIEIGQMATFGDIYNPLLHLARKVEYAEFKPADGTADEQRQFQELMSHLVCATVVPALEGYDYVHGALCPLCGDRKAESEPHALDCSYVTGIGENGFHRWERVTPAMPREDRDWLWGVATRAVTPWLDAMGHMEVMGTFRPEQDGGSTAPVVPGAGNRSSRRARTHR